MKEKRLIVNADDFGMSAGITNAILIARRHGFLTSASLMANMPGAGYALEQARRIPGFGVGVHLNICEGQPMLPRSHVKSLVDANGNFHAPPVMIRKLWRWQVADSEIEAEFRAQISWMKQKGFHPTHADSHHHMHLYPAALRPFARAVRVEGIQCVRASRFEYCSKDRTGRAPYNHSFLRGLAVRAYRAVSQISLLAPFKSPQSRLAFISDHKADCDAIRERWAGAFGCLSPGTYELACHPGLFDPAFSPTDRIHAQREAELYCLTDHALREHLQRNEVRLISYHDLAHRALMDGTIANAVAS